MARNLLGIRHLSAEDIEELLATSADFKLRIIEDKPVPDLSKQVVGMLFFENSTRTRVSFEQAAHYLKMKTANFAAGSSSMSKGETLGDRPSPSQNAYDDQVFRAAVRLEDFVCHAAKRAPHIPRIEQDCAHRGRLWHSLKSGGGGTGGAEERIERKPLPRPQAGHSRLFVAKP